MDDLFAICSTYEVDDASARGFVLAKPDAEGNNKPWPIFITRKGKSYYGFENACPHDGARLDARSGELMDDEGNFLTCSTCGSQFDLDTGHCFSGPAQNKDLTPVPLVVDDGDVCLVGVELADEDGLDLPESDVPEVMITSD
jgi:nitrite reductase/ring-hydroxylating ferredoxin subunit